MTGMRVGGDYQAVVPEMVSSLPGIVRTFVSLQSAITDWCPAPDHEPERAVLVWSPCNDIPDTKRKSVRLEHCNH